MSQERDIRQLKEDIYFKADLRGHSMKFLTTWGLFSPKQIDNGSYMLIDLVPVRPTDKVLDLGCGYGPIGLALAKEAKKGSVHMVDKDFVAIKYAKNNARLNKLHNTDIYLSNGLSAVKEKSFDLVVSNIPAKVGKEMLYIMLKEAKYSMKKGAQIYVVTITGLRQYIKREFTEIFGNYKKVKQGKQYTVAMATKE